MLSEKPSAGGTAASNLFLQWSNRRMKHLCGLGEG